MSARWEQFVFGKLVQRPGGPIVGADHGCTARSPGFPKGLVLTAHPGHTGIGIGTSFDWNKYPWQDTPGGFVARPVHDGDQAWVLAGRMRARPEDGEGCTGRRYTQAHYAAVPAEHWRPTALVALLPQLTTVPATEKDHQLPTLETDAPTLELPANWLQTITPILETVMSGHGISIQNWNTTPDEQVCLLAVCLSALPTSLAWRLDIGAGVVDMDGSFAIAHGMRAVKGVRIFKGERRGVEALDLSAGRAYVEWLRTVVDDCHSTEQLRQRIASLEHFDGWDAIPHTEGWVPAAGAIGAAMLEREILASLERWLTGATHHPPAVAQLQHMRPLAIKMALDHAESPGAWVLCDMLDPSWDQAWASAAEFAGERHLALATLLGKHGAPTSAHLAEMATVELPAEVVRLVVPNLEPLIRGAGRERDMTQWTALVRAAKADWAKTWVDGASACLLWLAHSEVDRPAASGLLAAISDTAAMRIVQQLQDRQVPGDDGLAWLARGLAMEPPHQAALDDMLGRIWAAGNPIGATRLALCAEQHGVGSRLLDTLQSPDLVRSAGLSTLAKQLAVATLQATSVAPKDVVRCVLLGWAHLADAQRDALIDVWIDRLEPAAALVLFGRHGQRAGDPSLLEVAREAAIVRLRADGESRSRLMSLFHDGDRPGPVRAGAAELARHLVQQDPTYWSQDAVLAALGVLYERRPPGGGPGSVVRTWRAWAGSCARSNAHPRSSR